MPLPLLYRVVPSCLPVHTAVLAHAEGYARVSIHPCPLSCPTQHSQLDRQVTSPTSRCLFEPGYNALFTHSRKSRGSCPAPQASWTSSRPSPSVRHLSSHSDPPPQHSQYQSLHLSGSVPSSQVSLHLELYPCSSSLHRENHGQLPRSSSQSHNATRTRLFYRFHSKVSMAQCYLHGA